MVTISAQDIKRRGIGAVDKLLERELVHIVKNNHPYYVVMREDDYQTMMEDLTLARIEASDADLAAGRIQRGSTADLLKALDEPSS